MKTMMLALGIIITALSAVSSAQTAAGDERSEFRFQFEQTEGPRGRAIHGWVYNGLPWRVTNIRLRVDCVDANSAIIGSGTGWVLGDVSAGGRAYFHVGVSSPAATHRVAVESFDKVAPEPLQAP